MRKIGEKLEFHGPVSGRTVIHLECSKEEQQEIRDALAVMAKVEKAMKFKRSYADWTMIHSFSFSKDGVRVVLEQGACG